MVAFYGIIILFPIFAVILNRFMGQSGSFFKQLVSEFYLWLALSIGFVGIYALVFSGLKIVLPTWVAFLFYCIVYWAFCIVRKTLWTSSSESDVFRKEIVK